MKTKPATTPSRIISVYVTLNLLTTLAASLIWGINTLFLLDAGLSITAAFAANAFFTLGEVFFEVPTGVVADTGGRRLSFLIGTVVLAISTLLYLLAWQTHAPFWAWALSSVVIGLGFTFFSGATDAWMVDALHSTGYTGPLEPVFAKAQIASGAAMLAGSVGGGILAQATNLGTPYIVRALLLLITFGVAWFFMHDLGFTPTRGEKVGAKIREILQTSVDRGLRFPPVRWVMLAGPFGAGVGIYAFYATQPYLLQLYHQHNAYSIAGLAAAIVAGSQIVGGMVVPRVVKLFGRRTTMLMLGVVLSAAVLISAGLFRNFWAVVGLLVVWGLVFAALSPVRSAYLNGLIPSEQRATVLSFDNLLASAGGVVIQPALGKVADVWSYAASFIAAGLISLLALPFLWLARTSKPASDPIK
jgi:MFS family permease